MKLNTRKFKNIRRGLLSIVTFVLMLGLFPSETIAQRMQQPLERGVVAVNNGFIVAISWRKLAQDSEQAKYNLYKRAIGASDYTLLNATPLSKTNYQTTTSSLPFNSEVCVALVVDGVEQSKSEPFQFNSQSIRSTFLDITYSTFLPHDEYTTKFVWPADLTGDGEYDYVVDRLSLKGSSHKIEGYTRSGEHLWTIDMGPNVDIDAGHNDMVLSYDMNCDGKAEVVIKSSDGTRFWDKANNTWGNYLKGAANGDTDGDGILDYTTQSVKNPPQYITVVNGLTGAELSTVEMTYPSDGTDTYTRNNKASYMEDDYSNLNGHMGICYLDGIYPSVAMEYMVRNIDKTHHYYVSAWGYNFVNGKATSWGEKFPTWSRNNKSPWPAEFHHIRIGDVDFDGKDEILEGGYTLDHDGKMLFSAGISHGDRFRVGDLDPDRPGLETYAIQQNAGDMLGQILYDATTGTAIKKWYLASVDDVGRGECMDVSAATKGAELWSTMGNLYDAKGNLVMTGAVNAELPFPTEGIWWDGELDRELLTSSDGNGYNADVRKFNGTRLIEFAKLSGWSLTSAYGKRPMFFGDIIGDWREEVILRRGGDAGCSGIVGFSTDYGTDISMYCLQQNSAYRMQCTTRGYYQSPIPDFYLGYDMPAPPLPTSIVADLVWKSGNVWNSSATNFVTFDRTQSAAFVNGKSVLFDVSGSDSEEINITGTLSPSVVYAMPPLGKTYKWTGTGILTGNMGLWKSQNGTLLIENALSYTGKTIISEGTLALNTTLTGPLDLHAKGTLAGNPHLNGDITFEGGLNKEGCRLSPGTEAAPYGCISFAKAVAFTGGVNLRMDIQTKDEVLVDSIKINGDLTLSGTNTVIINCSEVKPEPGNYSLIEWTGELVGDISELNLSGLEGISCVLKVVDKKIVLQINGVREPAKGVLWAGSVNGNWNFDTENFKLDGVNTTFVSGDEIIFNDEAITSVITVNGTVETTGMTFLNDTKNFVLTGTGAISGTGALVKQGTGNLTLSAVNSDYTGATIVNGGTLIVNELAEAGLPSSIGAATALPSNLKISDAAIIVNNANTATTRGMTIDGTATLNITSGYTTLKGIITGAGELVKKGSGQLNLTYAGSNTYTGGTLVNGGTLAMGAYNTTFGKLGSTLTIQSGTVQIFDNNSTSAIPNFNYAVVVPLGSTATLNAGSRCYINGSFSGEGAVKLSIPYVRTDMLADWSAFKGKLSVTGSQFRLSKAMDMSATALTLGDGLWMGHYGQGSASAISATSKIGSLTSTSATATLCNGTYNIGYDNTNTTFAGVLSGITVNKYGTGTWTLTGESSATINIYEGKVLANAASGYTTSSTINIQSTGTFAGSGSVKTVNVKSGGTLGAGISTVIPGSITIDGNLTLESGSTLSVKRRGTSSYDKFVVSGNVKMTDATIEISSSKDFVEADEIQLFNVNGTISGTYSISPTTPGDGLQWDTSALLSNGILRVVKATDLRAIQMEQIKVYPILVSDYCVVSLGTIKDKAIVRAINGSGKIVTTTTVEGEELIRLDLSNFAPGYYFISISLGDNTYTQKITKK